LIVLWTLAFGLGLAVIESMWLTRADRVSMVSVKSSWDDPRSNAYRGALSELNVEVYQGSPIGGKGVLTVYLLGYRRAGSHLTWDVATRKGRIVGATSAGRETSFDRNAIVAWMKESGVNTADPEVGREADIIERHIAALEKGVSVPPLGGFGSWGSTFTRGEGRATRAVQAARGVLWLGWAAGLVWLWRRSRRAWRVAVVTRGPDVTEQEVARVDEWDGSSLRGFE